MSTFSWYLRINVFLTKLASSDAFILYVHAYVHIYVPIVTLNCSDICVCNTEHKVLVCDCKYDYSCINLMKQINPLEKSKKVIN